MSLRQCETNGPATSDELMERTTRLSAPRAAALLLALALASCAYFLPPPSSAAAQRAGGRRVNARAVYQRNCARCHGATGAADTDQGRLYNATRFNDAGWWRSERPSNRRLRRVIVEGDTDGMPAFGTRLSRAQIDALVPYVRSLRGK